MSESKVCPHCNQLMPMDVAVCTHCGQPFGAGIAPPTPMSPPVAGPVIQHPVQPQDGPGYGIAALIIGIMSLFFMCFWLLSIPLGVLAIVSGCIGLKKQQRGLAVAGIVCGTLGILSNAIFFVALTVIAASASH